MSIYYFPKDDPDFSGIISYSPYHSIVCNKRPFGDVCAEEYLEFARADLARGDRAGLLDSFGNSKRCFHYHIDRLLFRFGLRDTTSNSDFPMKLELLRELRIISGTLLRVFNRERNAMEHDYIAPPREIVEGAIDLCELLLQATERYLTRTPARIRVVLASDDRDLILTLEPGSTCIRKFVVHGSTSEETKYGKVYKEPLFKLGDDSLSDGLSIEEKPDEAIPLKLENKDQWLQILRMFSAASSESPTHPHQYPEELLVIIQHVIPLKVAREAFEAMIRDKKIPKKKA